MSEARTNKYYYGNEVSQYGQEHNRVDYRTFAKAFDAVLNNSIMEELEAKGYYFDMVGGFIDNSEEIDAKQDEIDELEELQDKIDALQDEIDELEDEQPGEIYQFYIVSDNAVRILEENNEIVFYCEELDLYIWGVTHWGTSWDYVLTDIVLNEEGY